MTTRPESGHDDDGVRNVVANTFWSAQCTEWLPTWLHDHATAPFCTFTSGKNSDRPTVLDAAQSHVRETGHTVTFSCVIVWELSAVP